MSSFQIVKPTPFKLPISNDDQVLTNVNDKNAFTYIGYQFSSKNMFPSFPNIGSVNEVYNGPFTPFVKYLGGSLAVNGNIYLMPCPFAFNQQTHGSLWTYNIGIFNPYTNHLDTTTFSTTRYPELSGKFFFGSVTAPNGKIYGIPFSSSYVLIIDPLTNTIDTRTISGLNTSIHSYKGGVLAPNGKIYCAPGSFTGVGVGVIDTNNDTFYTIPVSTPPGSGGFGYYGGAIGKNGCIYFAPHRSFGGEPLKVDPTTDTVSHLSGFNLGSTYGAVRGKDGNVYIMPYANGTIPKINVENDTYSSMGIRPYTCIGGILGQNGLIYMLPAQTNETRLTALNTDITGLVTLNNAFTAIGNRSDSRIGAVMGPNGIIYTVPSEVGTISSIKTGIPLIEWPIAPSFNKF